MIDAGGVAAPSGNGGSGRGRSGASLDRVLRALNHPLRRRILRALLGGSRSAVALSRELRENLGLISYHLNQVLAKECEVVDLVATVPRRGATEKIYALRDRREMSLEESLIFAVAAMETNAFESDEGGTWDWFLAEVDSEGWREICDAAEDFNRNTRAAVDGSRARAGEAQTREVVVGAVAFPAESPPPPPS